MLPIVYFVRIWVILINFSNSKNFYINKILSDYIPIVFNTSFSYLESQYLEQGMPVIVDESHKPQNLNDFLKSLKLQNDFLESEPCDIFTNLMLRKHFNLEIALDKIQNYKKWFLQLRNCQSKAVKASRSFVNRPYYYPLNMEPFYSSWILAAHQKELKLRDIYVKGLIFIQQLSGIFEYHLSPKQPCNEKCPVLKMKLNAGECLVYSTELWNLSYGLSLVDIKSETAIATILEIDWMY